MWAGFMTTIMLYTHFELINHNTHNVILCISQVRDDYRTDYDEQRGGVGGGTLRQMERQGFDTSSLRLSFSGEDEPMKS